MIEQDFHTRALSRFETALRVLQHRVDLGVFDTWKLHQKFLHGRAAFEIFNQRLDRHARAIEEPGAADFSRNLLHCRTL